ncbi:hypothetical protein ACGTNG_06320 [Halomonas sp. 1390]|uniref:hypothetical protein n=1 Tax=Halomonas sp. B23F22_3 TaxID=3459516 RepID=UPI00373F1358
MNLIAALLMALGLSLSSLYLFPSGQPQPADFILLAFAAVMVAMALRDDELVLSPFALAWGLMLVWILLVCLTWTLVTQSTAFFIHVAFFLFNFLIGMALLRLLGVYGDKVHGLIRTALSLALLISASQVMVQLALGSGRTTGSFNNPNQLAFFSLCGIVILMLLDDFHPRMRLTTLVGLGAALVGIFAASSLAALGGLTLVALAWALANVVSFKQLLRLSVVVAGLCALLLVIDLQSGGQVQHNLTARLDMAPTKVDRMVEERQFDRLLNFPHYAILGAGEAERQRFAPHDSHEIHSSFINMLFAYGLPGLGLFLVLLAAAVWRAPLYVWVGLAGPLLYSVTHNGLRTTLFWVMLTLCWHLYHRLPDRWDEAALSSRQLR